MQDDYTTPEAIPLKRCSKCKKKFPATPEYFFRRAANTDGLMGRCKVCLAEIRMADPDKEKNRQRAYREANAEKAKAATRKYYNSHKTERAAYRKKYADANPGKATEDARKSKSKNPERTRTLEREWVSTNKAKVRQSAKKHYDAHKKEKAEWAKEYKKNHPDKRRATQQKYAAANLDKGRAKMVRRRARKAGLPNTFTSEHWQTALDYFKGCCAVCSRPLNGIFHTAHADHWIPLVASNCPGSVPENMIPLCGGTDGCNQSKNDSSAEPWLISKFGPREAAKILARINAYWEYVKSQHD